MIAETGKNSVASVPDTMPGATQKTAQRLDASIFVEPARVGRYDLIYRVGSGGMAAVYAGRLAGLAGFERLVAVKLIHKHLADAKRFVDMFLDEARVAATIHHPNVAEIYEVGKDKDLFFMVGEFVHGQDLGRLLRRADERDHELTHGLLSRLGADVCFGLHAAHETKDKDGNPLNLIHRDISPNNILISYDGFVKIIDFGVAWARNRLAHTESGALKGKVGYVAPEQITGQVLDRRSDIFSVGVMQYIMATMTHPFPGSSDAERLQKIVTGNVAPPRAVCPNVPEELERIIMKAMALSPDDRYATAAQLGRDLEAFAESTGDAIKNGDRAEIMAALFEDEVREHQTRLNLYRESAALNASKRPIDPDGAVDVGNTSAEILNDVLLDAAVKRATWRNMWIFSALTLMVLSLAVAVFFLYKDKEEKEVNEMAPSTPLGTAQTAEDDSIESPGRRPADTPEPRGESPAAAENAAPQPASAPSFEPSTTKGAAAKRKKPPSKSDEPELIQNPYSPR